MIGRRNFLTLSAAATLASAMPRIAASTSITPPKRRWLIDCLGGIINPNRDDDIDAAADRGVDARSLDDARTAGLTAFNQTIGYVSGEIDPFEYSVQEIGVWDALIRSRPGRLLKVHGVADLENAHASGQVGVILGFQNAAMMGKDPDRTAIFGNLGVKVIQLTYNVRNDLGDGCMVAENHGLTEFGRKVVAGLNAAKVMVDLSHSGEQTCLDAIAASKAPILISHTGCRAVADLPRNKTDRELRGVAEGGGLVGIYFMPFLAIERQPTAEDLIAHIEHAWKVAGEDHVALGTDGTLPKIDDMGKYWEALKKDVEQRRAAGIGAKGERADIATFLPDLQGPDKFARLGEMLVKRGHSESRVDKLLGGNFYEYAKRVW